MVPPTDVEPQAIDKFVAALRRLWSFEAPYLDAFVFGPVEAEKFRRFVLAHAAHHLGFFEPKTV